MSFIMPESFHAREKQAMQDRIDKLYKREQELMKENENLMRKLTQVELAGRYYLRMQKHILEYENIGEAWKEFLTIYMLCIPDKSELEPLPQTNDYTYY